MPAYKETPVHKKFDEIIQIASKIKLMIFDVDGVFTDGRMYLTDDGISCKAFHARDGLGIKMLQKAGIEVAIITGCPSKLVQIRMQQQLGLQHIYRDQKNKIACYEELKNKLSLRDEEIAFIGDDINDISVIKRCGLGIAVANAMPAVQKYAKWQTQLPGGSGAVREICELVLQAQNSLEKIYELYCE
jgi:3-deoxy-D-manno-octulosonate 8-phosphate phosphatase (KDO 8-P phosphatase)